MIIIILLLYFIEMGLNNFVLEIINLKGCGALLIISYWFKKSDLVIFCKFSCIIKLLSKKHIF